MARVATGCQCTQMACIAMRHRLHSRGGVHQPRTIFEVFCPQPTPRRAFVLDLSCVPPPKCSKTVPTLSRKCVATQPHVRRLLFSGAPVHGAQLQPRMVIVKLELWDACCYLTLLRLVAGNWPSPPFRCGANRGRSKHKLANKHGERSELVRVERPCSDANKVRSGEGR
jgi:hypothetical protein